MGPPFPWSFWVDLFLEQPSINLSLTFFWSSLYRGLHFKRALKTLGSQSVHWGPKLFCCVPDGTPKAYKVTSMILYTVFKQFYTIPENSVLRTQMTVDLWPLSQDPVRPEWQFSHSSMSAQRQFRHQSFKINSTLYDPLDMFHGCICICPVWYTGDILKWPCLSAHSHTATPRRQVTGVERSYVVAHLAVSPAG